MLLRVFSFSFIDMYGNPLDGGKLYTYVTRTTTPATTYSDVEGTLNTNPIILDARGSASIYIEDSNTYRFVLKNREGDTIWSADDITYDNIGQLPDHVIDRIQGYENEVDVSYDSANHLYIIRLSNYIRERIEKIAEVEQSIDEINDEISDINDTLSIHTQNLEELGRTKAEKYFVDKLSEKVTKNSNDISDLNEKIGKLVFNAHYEYAGTSTFEEVLNAKLSGADIVNLYTLIDASIVVLNLKRIIFDETGNDPIAFEFSEVFGKKIHTYRLNKDNSWIITVEDCGGGSGGGIEDAPDDDEAYLRMNGMWVTLEFAGNFKATDELDPKSFICDEADNLNVVQDEV